MSVVDYVQTARSPPSSVLDENSSSFASALRRSSWFGI